MIGDFTLHLNHISRHLLVQKNHLFSILHNRSCDNVTNPIMQSIQHILLQAMNYGNNSTK
ncbi:hypothetical protein Xmau_01007 [Xenorhabdus mauleonii]|uniref:Uncharacterized protein n=1 Tax=Xenorhabdus mauleonii TaxID=351675 RepID=A0A1I3LZV7_9GAMM|nr:hypothetical protein Xmau_01007 [Xenorhabdus mauleonii]SFI90309.1 hypothetical protein SAMN05421680_104124 [Xenorhabdus mauleonii]